MPEEIIWKGTSSHWKNFKPYVLTLLSIPVCAGLHSWLHPKVGPWIYGVAGIFALWALWNWLVIRSTTYELTSERLITTSGILTKVTNTLELYRVRDMQVVQPLLQRIVGMQNVHVITSDASTPEIILDFMKTNLELGEKLRKSVEACREAKRVRSMDVVNEQPGDHQHP
jgi:uncharacterized membrane protein YdbT with pleckstrin-like domain